MAQGKRSKSGPGSLHSPCSREKALQLQCHHVPQQGHCPSVLALPVTPAQGKNSPAKETPTALTFHGLTDWFGWDGTVKGHPVQPPAMGRDISNQVRVLRAPSNLVWNGSRDGASPTSLGNLGQGLATLSINNFFLKFSLNLPSFSLKPSPLVLSPHVLVKSPSPALLQVLAGCSKVSLQPSPLQPEQLQHSQPFLPAEGFQPSHHCWGLFWPRSHSSSSVLC